MAVVTAHVRGSFYGPCSTRPCTRVPTCYVLHDRLHGRIQAMYTVRTVHDRGHDFVRSYTRLSTRPCARLCTRPHMVVSTAVYGKCTHLQAVYTRVHGCVYGPCARPVHGRVQYTAVNRPCTACTRSCTRVHGRVYGPCTWPCTRPYTQAMAVCGPCPGLFMRGVSVLGLSVTILMKHLLLNIIC